MGPPRRLQYQPPWLTFLGFLRLGFRFASAFLIDPKGSGWAYAFGAAFAFAHRCPCPSSLDLALAQIGFDGDLALVRVDPHYKISLLNRC